MLYISEPIIGKEIVLIFHYERKWSKRLFSFNGKINHCLGVYHSLSLPKPIKCLHLTPNFMELLNTFLYIFNRVHLAQIVMGVEVRHSGIAQLSSVNLVCTIFGYKIIAFKIVYAWTFFGVNVC